MSHTRVIVAGTAALLALTACGAGGATTTPSQGAAPSRAAGSSAPASGGAASSAPASKGTSSAPAGGSGSADKPSTPATELAVAGSVAGLDLKPISAEDRQKGGDLSKMASSAKVEPASCQKILKYSQATDPATSGGAFAASGKSAYGTGVGASAVPLKQMKDDTRACPKMTMDMGGMKVAIQTTVTDITAPGVTNGYRVVQSFDIAGQKQQNIVQNGEVRGLVVSAFGMSGADAAKVDELFKAQVDKVAKAK